MGIMWQTLLNLGPVNMEVYSIFDDDHGISQRLRKVENTITWFGLILMEVNMEVSIQKQFMYVYGFLAHSLYLHSLNWFCICVAMTYGNIFVALNAGAREIDIILWLIIYNIILYVSVNVVNISKDKDITHPSPIFFLLLHMVNPQSISINPCGLTVHYYLKPAYIP